MTIPLKHQITPEAADVFKRILRQKGEADHIDKLVGAVCSRLKAGLNANFEMLGFEVYWSIEGKNESFDFRDLNDTRLFILKTETDQFPAAICVAPEEAVKIVDMMLGADPALEAHAELTELTELQESILEEFGALCASSVETVLQLQSRLNLEKMAGQGIQSRIGEHATLSMSLAHGNGEYRFSMLISQSAILKLNFREKPPAPSAEKKGSITPEKDVDIELSGIVYIENLMLSDIANLRIGDTLSVREGKYCHTTLTTGGRKLHRCQIGQDDSHHALLVEAAHESMQTIITSAV